MTTSGPSEAQHLAFSTPLADLDPARLDRFRDDSFWPVFDRLREEDPVHLSEGGEFGRYWSITRYNDILEIDTNHRVFSSEPGIALTRLEEQTAQTEFHQLPMFIAMDPPRHDVQRRAVAPSVSPTNLRMLEPLIRSRACAILDDLPIGEEFDWVDKVSMELTAMTLATLFGMPQEDRRRLTYWSDVATAVPGGALIESREQRVAILRDYQAYFTKMWNARVNAEPTGDLISMLAHSPDTRRMSPIEYFGNVVLLTVGGNDTTRNTITGSVYFLNKNADQYARLRADRSLIPAMVSETIRYQTPLAHMKRRAVHDLGFRGKTIRAGDTVAMWYVSGNRDAEAIERPYDYAIDRKNPRQHISFGFGVHRCVGSRLAELQLRIIWEEILERFPEIVVLDEPRRVTSNFVKGYESMRVIIPTRSGQKSPK